MSEPYRCRFCGSADTVGYWDIRENRDDHSHMTETCRQYYPNARKCIDCGFVENDAHRPPTVDFSKVRKL